MPKYDVNVRAVVTATRAEENPQGTIPGWEEYDFEALERDADDQPVVVQIRCDQMVTVVAEDQEHAIEMAKADATAITVEGYTIDAVTIWVDEGIDIELAFDQPSHAPGC